MYSYSLDLILLFLAHSTPVLPQPPLAPRALHAWRTHLGLRSLSTPDPLELLWSSGHLTIDPSNTSQTSFHPCIALVPVTGPANVQQTGSQPACRTRLLVPPLVARLDSSQSSVHDMTHSFDDSRCSQYIDKHDVDLFTYSDYLILFSLIPCHLDAPKMSKSGLGLYKCNKSNNQRLSTK